MAQNRKTRQQKISRSNRKQSQDTALPTQSPVEKSNNGAATLTPHQAEIAATQEYVVEELRRIGWISLICFVLLVIATLLLADFAWIVDFRQAIGLPESLIK